MKRARRSLLAAAALGAVLAAAAPALAGDATVFASEAEYDAAAGASDFCIDFNGSTGSIVDGGVFRTEIAFGSPEVPSAPTVVVWSSDAITDAGSVVAPNGVGPVSGAFSGTADAFKLRFLSAAIPPSVELYDAADALIDTVTAPTGSGFFGVVSATPIQRFVIRPGLFDEITFFRDRFFIDDFCATGVVGTPGEDPGSDLPDLEALCADLAATVADAPASSFSNAGKRGALLNKLDEVCGYIETGDLDSLCEAIDKLTHDVLPKTDGDGSPADWVTDPALQQDLEDAILDLLDALRDAADALGGC